MFCPTTAFQIRDTDAILQVVAAGELDQLSLSYLQDVARRAREQTGRKVRLDLSGVTRLDAAAIPGILAVQEAARGAGGQFDVLAADAATAATLRAAGVCGVAYPG